MRRQLIRFPESTRGSQRGATLVIALVLLLVMSIVAITSMTTSILEEKMSVNMQNAVNVFQVAESGIDETINDIPLLGSVPLTEGASRPNSPTLSAGSKASANVDVFFVKANLPDTGSTTNATQAGGSWSGSLGTFYFEAQSTATLNDNPAINATLVQGFYYCPAKCQ